MTVHAVRPPVRADKMLPLLLETTRIIVDLLMILYWEGVCGAGETAGLEAPEGNPGPRSCTSCLQTVRKV